MKLCPKCGQSKSVDSFTKARRTKDGLSCWCRACVRVANASYRAANPDYFKQYRQVNARRYSALRKEWKRKNADKVAGYKAKRRARKLGVDYEPYTKSEIHERWGNRCCYCDAPSEHVDHVHPISKGGADAPHNLVAACADCNLIKSDKTLAEWASTF